MNCRLRPLILACLLLSFAGYGQETYKVSRVRKEVVIDGNWNKRVWKRVKPVRIAQKMGPIPHYVPETEAKVRYDDANLYVIFRVRDRYVKSVVQTYNGNVSGDSCVEFFFAPDSTQPGRYFNLEINAGGTPLIFYVTKPWQEFTRLGKEHIDRIAIAHSLPPVVNPELEGPVTWTIECRIPFDMLKTFCTISIPKPGTAWRANFYKTGSRTSNPHWLTWTFVNHPKPNFHLPEYFGKLLFR